MFPIADPAADLFRKLKDLRDSSVASDEREMEARYLAAAHGIQSAIAWLMALGDTLAEPKHLRDGARFGFPNRIPVYEVAEATRSRKRQTVQHSGILAHSATSAVKKRYSAPK